VAEGFEISVVAADILGERCGVDLHIPPFELPHAGYTDAERGRLAQGVMRDLEGRGLAYRGRLEPDVEDALVLLGRAPVSASMVLATRSGRGQAVARIASNGRLAVLAVQDGDVVRVELVRPTGVIGALVGLVRDRRPIKGGAVTFPVEDAVPDSDAGRDRDRDDDGGGGGGGGGGGSLMHQPRRRDGGYGQQRRLADAMAQRLRGRAGTVSVVARDRHGRERQVAMVVWHDTDAGRYMVYQTTGSDGREWVSYAPADNARLAQQLGEFWSVHEVVGY
jgi:hypothetical protein